MKKVIAVLAILNSYAVYAGTQEGKIAYLIVRESDQMHYFAIDGEEIGKPECAKKRYWMIKNETSQAGKNQWNLLTLAYAMGKPVIVRGSGKCTRWVDGEDVETIQLKD